MLIFIAIGVVASHMSSYVQMTPAVESVMSAIAVVSLVGGIAFTIYSLVKGTPSSSISARASTGGVSASRFNLSHFSLHAPSVVLPYWFVSHDFADALHLEYSEEARTQLEGLLSGLGVQVDHEADSVTLRIKRNADVIPALRAMYAHVGWAQAELEQIEMAVRNFKRPRAKAIAEGDIFLIPIGDDMVGLGQVLKMSHKAPTVAVFRVVGLARDIERDDPASLKPLAILHLGLGCSLFTGGWPVISKRPVVHSPARGFGGARDGTGAVSFGGDGCVVSLLRAHAGLDTWEHGFADPAYLRKFVLE